MIRLICHETDATEAANVGGPVRVMHKTFDIDAPEVERWLNESLKWKTRGFVGIELHSGVSNG